MNAEKLVKAIIVSTVILGLWVVPAVAAPPPITYQGQLKYEDVPYNGQAAFVFKLYDADVGGTLMGTDTAELLVVNGLFTAELTFDTLFDGNPRWLEIEVRTQEQGWTTLEPRQLLTPVPFALYAYDAPGGSGGECLWTESGGDIYYTAGDVGVGTSSPSYQLHVKDRSADTAVVAGVNDTTATTGFLGHPEAGVFGTGDTGVIGQTINPDRAAVYGENLATTGIAAGVYGKSESRSGFGGWFVGKGYFSGSVGIGTTMPSSALDVDGTVRMTGFKLGTTATAGQVLTTDATGVGTWQTLPAGSESPWSTNGTDVYYNGGEVGIGLANPDTQLHVYGGDYLNGDVKIGSIADYLQIGVWNSGVGAGEANIRATGAKLLLGSAGVPTMTLRGTNVGIGQEYPGAKLDVNGNIKATSIQLTTGATSGHVLTSDASGNATWQAPTGGGGDLTLPFEDTITHSGSAFKITNSGTSAATHAFAGIINGATSSDASAAYFSAVGAGHAIHSESDGDSTVYAHNSGVGNAVYGLTSGAGGGYFSSSQDGGYGVRGRSSSTGSSTANRGGYFTAASATGTGVYAEAPSIGVDAVATGPYGIALRAIAEGGEGYGIHTESPWIGLYAKGGLNAAKFYGNVRVYEYGTTNQVFAVKNDGTTQVDVLQIMGGSDLAEKFDVSEQVEPGTVVAIDAKNPGKLCVARGAYNRRVAGVVSGANDLGVGMVLADLPGAENSHPIALSGRVWVRCDATGNAIEPGDLLTTSEMPGHAMKAADYDRAHGAVIGKAMTQLDQGETGMVLVLVNLQ